MYKYNIYIGKFDKDSKLQTLTHEEFLNIINKTLLEYNITCFSIYNILGFYKHEDGTRIKEPSINIEIIDNYDLNSDYFIGIKSTLCQKLNQESILITKQEIQVL